MIARFSATKDPTPDGHFVATFFGRWGDAKANPSGKREVPIPVQELHVLYSDHMFRCTVSCEASPLRFDVEKCTCWLVSVAPGDPERVAAFGRVEDECTDAFLAFRRTSLGVPGISSGVRKDRQGMAIRRFAIVMNLVGQDGLRVEVRMGCFQLRSKAPYGFKRSRTEEEEEEEEEEDIDFEIDPREHGRRIQRPRIVYE